MSVTIRYGEPVKARVKAGYGLQAFIANLFFEDEVAGTTSNDACLVVCRRAFGIGKSHIIRRKELHQILDKDGEWLARTADDTAQFLWNGQASAREQHIVMDCIMDNIDELVMHKPENQNLNLKALDSYFEGEETFTHGLMDIINDH